MKIDYFFNNFKVWFINNYKMRFRIEIMYITAIIINGIALAALILAFIKDKDKAVQSLRMAFKSYIKMLPMVFIIIIAIGLLLGFVTPDQISRFVRDQSGIGGFNTYWSSGCPYAHSCFVIFSFSILNS